jgi:putative spermidine/putrescine transport system substrate-binding protein
MARHRGLVLPALAAIAVLVASCGTPQPPSTPAPNTVSADAKPEAELLFAGGGGAIGDTYKALLDEFGKRHNVKVTYVEGTSASGFSRIQAEAQAGRPEIDMQNNNDQTLALGVGQQLWQPLNMALLPNAERIDKDVAFPSNVVGDPPMGIRLLVIPVGIAYNTETFAKNGWPAPTSWEDLYNPTYASCTIPLSPKSGVNYVPMLNKINTGKYEDITETIKRFEAIRDRVPVWSDSNPNALELLQQGVGCITPTQQGRAVELATKGAPIKFVQPKEGTPFLGGTIGIVKNAPHSVAAQMFLNELLSKEAGQQLLEKAFFTSVNLDVTKPTSGPAAELSVASEFDKVKLTEIPLEALEKTDEWIQRFTQLAAG